MPSLFPLRLTRLEWRLIASFLLSALIVTAVVVTQTGRHQRQQLLATYQTRLGYVSQTRNAILRQQLDQLERDARFLSATPPIAGIIRASAKQGFDQQENTTTDIWRKRLDTIFSAFLQANPDISALRLIGAKDNGKELVRVERDPYGAIRVVPDAQLARRGGRDYVADALRLPPGQAYFSDFVMGSHHIGRDGPPPVPTIHVGMPVHDGEGRVFGEVLIHYNATRLLGSLTRNIPVELNLYLTDQQGNYLLQPDASRTFGAEKGRVWRWQDDFRPTTIDLGQPASLRAFDSPYGVAYAHSIQVPFSSSQPDHYSKLFVVLPDSVVETMAADARTSALLNTLGVFLLLGVLCGLYFRKFRQAAFRQAELAAIVESSSDAIIGCTLQGRIISWNAAAARLFGQPTGQAMGRQLDDMLPYAGAPLLPRLLSACQDDDRPPLRLTLPQADGSARQLDIAVSPIRYRRQEAGGISLTLRDVTQQEAAEKRVRELNASLEQQIEERTRQLRVYSSMQNAILAHAGYAIIAADGEGVITLFNPAAERMLGYPAAEMIGRRSLAHFHCAEELAARAIQLSHELGETIGADAEAIVAPVWSQATDERQWTYIRANGERFPVQLTVSRLENEAGEAAGYLAIASDITQRLQDQRNLESTRDQLIKAAEVAELGIWSWRLDSDTLEWNDRMFDIYDIPRSFRDFGLYYNHWRARIHPDDIAETEFLLQQSLENGSSFSHTFRIVCQDGSTRHVQAAALMELSAEGKPYRMMGINRDITLEREQENWLRAAKAAADSANRAKSDFLANMSHEIRTPMNAVLGMLQLLRQSRLDAHQADYADKAAAAAHTLLGILNDILDFSRVEAGKLTLDPHPLSLDKLLRDVGVILSANVGAKDVEILFELDPALPDAIVADSLRLQQILINLSGNAIKFTDKGEVALSARLAEREGERVRIAFAVRDTGIGITPEQCQRIFEGFSQAESSTARRYGGSGLGLAISQRLVSLMGGQLRVASEPGKGSTFSFEIECELATAAEPAPSAGIVPMRGLRCLVIDDNDSARQAQSATLRAFGWQVDEAASGEAALSMLSDQAAGLDYDIVLVDWRMPGMDGWQTCAELRRLACDNPPPLIMMITAYAREMLQQLDPAQSSIVDRFLIKPVTPSMLFDAIADARAHRGLREALPPRDAGQGPRLAGLRLLLVEDNPTNQQVARELLKNEGAEVDVVDCGQAALSALANPASRYDLVLMDIQMPDMDGYEATRRLRARHAADALPIVAMTANVMPTDRERALAAGMNDHVGKPFDLDQLVGVILRLARGDAPDGAARPATPPIVLPEGGRLNSRQALARFGDNVKIYCHTLLSFCGEAEGLLVSLQGQRKQDQRQSAVQTLHTLKGLAATVGAEQLSALAAEQEAILRDPARSWPADYDALWQAAEEAVAAARQLAGQLLPAPAAEAAPPDDSEFQHELASLQRLLQDSNLQALQQFDQMQQHYRLAMPQALGQLETAIMQMDFAAASRLCEALLKQQKVDQT
ncbi:response regulator [Chromobacterium paludis]|uniref:Sensory/regulatory protein RpfC n=1 Tax=Chromobacterium paludis TaxID=2605945 RepID=A0A5C1DJS3_9NEIS|nr:response regulator [Chromobacterium paludis]QEL56219.1 response regulator [Chromobacterium paludis]